MNKSTKTILACAALAGLYAGSFALRALADDAKPGTAASTSKDAGKHDCKGKNDCKGQGGCKTSDAGCKAKNTCKGKGGCSTMDAPAATPVTTPATSSSSSTTATTSTPSK
jgi:hypothetical protein